MNTTPIPSRHFRRGKGKFAIRRKQHNAVTKAPVSMIPVLEAVTVDRAKRLAKETSPTVQASLRETGCKMTAATGTRKAGPKRLPKNENGELIPGPLSMPSLVMCTRA